MDERDLINYITSPILSSIDDDNQRLELLEESEQSSFSNTNILSSMNRSATNFTRPESLFSLNSNELGNGYAGLTQAQPQPQSQQQDSVSSLISPQFSRLTTKDVQDSSSMLGGDGSQNSLSGVVAPNSFLSLNVPSRSNTLSPSNSRFYDLKNSALLGQSNTGTLGSSHNLSTSGFFGSESAFSIQRPLSAMDLGSNNNSISAPFMSQQNSFNHFNAQDYNQQSPFGKAEPLNGTKSFPRQSVNFDAELFDFKIWLENLNSKQQLYVVDLITKTLDEENLNLLRRKLDLSLGVLDNYDMMDQMRPKSADLLHPNQESIPVSRQLFPTMMDQNYIQRRNDFQNLQNLQQPIPQQKSRQRNLNAQSSQNNPMNAYNNGRPKSPMNYEDLSNQNFLKLNALSTIQSRAKLDNGKRHIPNEERGRTNQYQNMYNMSGNPQSPHSSVNGNNRYKTSSVPPIGRTSGVALQQEKGIRRSGTPLSTTSTPSISQSGQAQQVQQASSPQGQNSNETNKILNDSLLKLASINNIKQLQHQQQFQSPQSPSMSLITSPVLGASPTSKSPMPKDISSLELLNNIPQWLKILRLHKYTDILSSLDWKVMINLTDEELDEMGISTLGARRKLLKAFSAVKETFERGEIS